jgi:hypothetical protein
MDDSVKWIKSKIPGWDFSSTGLLRNDKGEYARVQKSIKNRTLGYYEIRINKKRHWLFIGKELKKNFGIETKYERKMSENYLIDKFIYGSF